MKKFKKIRVLALLAIGTMYVFFDFNTSLYSSEKKLNTDIKVESRKYMRQNSEVIKKSIFESKKDQRFLKSEKISTNNLKSPAKKKVDTDESGYTHRQRPKDVAYYKRITNGLAVQGLNLTQKDLFDLESISVDKLVVLGLKAEELVANGETELSEDIIGFILRYIDSQPKKDNLSKAIIALYNAPSVNITDDLVERFYAEDDAYLKRSYLYLLLNRESVSENVKEQVISDVKDLEDNFLLSVVNTWRKQYNAK